jgi:hypothetical protein
MNQSKRSSILIVCLILCLSFFVCSCSSAKSNQDDTKTELNYEGNLVIKDGNENYEIAYNEIYAMEAELRTVKNISSSGEEKVNEVKGVLLETILSKNGIHQKDYNSIRLVAGDGYAIDVPYDIISEKDIVLAYIFDGEVLDNKKMPLRAAIDDVRSMYYVSNLSEIVLTRQIDEGKESAVESKAEVILLEVAAKGLDITDYTYYENVDKAIKVEDLFDKYLNAKTDSISFMASDGFKKTENYDVLMQGFIKISGDNSPLFISPDLPKGMHVKKILSIKSADTVFLSIEKAIEVIPNKTIDEKEGVLVSELIDYLGLGDLFFKFEAEDGYSIEVSKEQLKSAIIYPVSEGVYGLQFEPSFPKSVNIKGLARIEGSTGEKAVKTADDNKKNSQNSSQGWTITVDGLSDGSFDLSSEKASRKFERVKIHTERIKNDNPVPEDWEGYKVSDILEFLRVDTYNSIVITAIDGYSAEFLKDEIDDETILAFIRNGEAMTDESNMLQFVQNTKFATKWVKGVSKITVK